MVRLETRDRILKVLGDQKMTKRRLMYLAHPCSSSTVDKLIKEGDLVIVMREPVARPTHRVIKGQPILCAAVHAEKYKGAA